MPILTLTTDFGLKDGFVGTMKGVILGICTEAQLIDISHSISPQNVLEAAIVIWRAHAFFPPGTVHLVVVDPGVGTRRRGLAVKIGEHYFVGPDNGVLTYICEDAEAQGRNMQFIELSNTKFWLENISRTFHGRDIFSPVAAHLARGVPIKELGLPITDPARIQILKPERTSSGWLIHIMIVDVFGNCTTDLRASDVSGSREISFQIHGHVIHGLEESYGHRAPGELVALVNSENCIEIAMVNGSAAQTLGLQVGDIINATTG